MIFLENGLVIVFPPYFMYDFSITHDAMPSQMQPKMPPPLVLLMSVGYVVVIETKLVFAK